MRSRTAARHKGPGSQHAQRALALSTPRGPWLSARPEGPGSQHARRSLALSTSCPCSHPPPQKPARLLGATPEPEEGRQTRRGAEEGPLYGLCSGACPRVVQPHRLRPSRRKEGLLGSLGNFLGGKASTEASPALPVQRAGLAVPQLTTTARPRLLGADSLGSWLRCAPLDETTELL